MMWAEVIGDPIAHSRSPAIHSFWLDALGLEGDFLATRVPTDGLDAFFVERRGDTDWRGCNVTAPHKLAVLPFLDRLSEAAGSSGAVNCILREGETLTGRNTDVDGVGEALAGLDLAGRKVVLIGAGGAARAALAWLETVVPGEIIILARDPSKAVQLLGSADNLRVMPFDRAAEAFDGAALVVNASPLGMAHAGPPPQALLDALAGAAPGATLFDMVYHPLDTPLLQAARRHGLARVDGLSMLIGQAATAFRLLFDAEPPREHDRVLREILAAR
jgi:shikimate dehydrogenase